LDPPVHCFLGCNTTHHGTATSKETVKVTQKVTTIETAKVKVIEMSWEK
jgi:hypothetical protein